MTNIKEVAKHAGVSITTVSHVLNHPERVSKEMQKRVLQAIDDLKYQPTPHAQSLRTGRTNLVGLLIPDICNPFYPELVKVIQVELGQTGMDTLIYNTDVPGGMSATHIAHYLNQIAQKRLDAVIIAGEALTGNEELLTMLDLPAVYIGHLNQSLIDYVTIDDYAAAYDATRYLIEKGHRRIGHISGEPRFFSGRARQQGYEQALRDHGLPVDASLIYEGTYLRPAGRSGIRYLLNLAQPPTAVFIANSLMALAALATLYDMNLQVPDDVALMTFDEIAEMEDVRPKLTTIDYNPHTLGEVAVRLLLERLEGNGTTSPQAIRVPYTLLKRDSA
ncbi:MAG: LacI family transcriptional regulator [Chloroflexi bacterium]|nr:LacI family transcriptional regulator [Chloroflexota bacterium]